VREGQPADFGAASAGSRRGRPAGGVAGF
jgi:hypothetical protein